MSDKQKLLLNLGFSCLVDRMTLIHPISMQFGHAQGHAHLGCGTQALGPYISGTPQGCCCSHTVPWVKNKTGVLLDAHPCAGSQGAIKSTHRTPSKQERGSTASFHPAQRKCSSWKQHSHGTEYVVTSSCLSPTAGKTPPEHERGGARCSTKEQQSALKFLSFLTFAANHAHTKIKNNNS